MSSIPLIQFITIQNSIATYHKTFNKMQFFLTYIRSIIVDLVKEKIMSTITRGHPIHKRKFNREKCDNMSHSSTGVSGSFYNWVASTTYIMHCLMLIDIKNYNFMLQWYRFVCSNWIYNINNINHKIRYFVYWNHCRLFDVILKIKLFTIILRSICYRYKYYYVYALWNFYLNFLNLFAFNVIHRNKR